MDLTETPEGWSSPAVGFNVIEVMFSGQTYVTAYGTSADGEREAPNTRISLGGKFTLRDSAGTTHLLDAEGDWADLMPLLSLRHSQIVSALAGRDGRLTVKFNNGEILEADSDPHYENWELMGPGGILIVAMPGGGEPTIWDGKSDQR